MYKNLGIHWASSIPAFLALACVPFPFLFYKYGEPIRMKCKYAAEAARVLKEMMNKPDEDEYEAEQEVEEEEKEEEKEGERMDLRTIRSQAQMSTKSGKSRRSARNDLARISSNKYGGAYGL